MEHRGSSRIALALVALLALAGSAAAIVTLIAAAGPVAALAPAPGVFAMPVVINTQPIAVGGYGDQIVTVEEGRDSISPFCEIAVFINPANPSWAALGGAPGTPNTVPQMYARASAAFFYPPPVQGIWGTVQNNPPIPILLLFTYRPTNDPENPGWGAPPATAAVGQVESNLQAVHHVAQAFTSLRASVPPANAPACAWAEIYIDPNAANPSFLEFWQYHVAY
jgi:hypothetical protein